MHSGTPVLGKIMGLMRPAKHNPVPHAAAEDSAAAGKQDNATTDDLPRGKANFDKGYVLGLETSKGQRARATGQCTPWRMDSGVGNAGPSPGAEDVHPHFSTQASIVVLGPVSPNLMRLLESPKLQSLAGSPILVLQHNQPPECYASPCPGSGRLIPRGIAWEDQRMSSGLKPPRAVAAPTPNTAGSVRGLLCATAVKEQLPSVHSTVPETGTTKQGNNKRTKSPPSGDKNRPTKHGHPLQSEEQVVQAAEGSSRPLPASSLQDLQLDFQDLLRQDLDQPPAEDEEQLQRVLFGTQHDDNTPITADVFESSQIPAASEQPSSADDKMSQSQTTGIKSGSGAGDKSMPDGHTSTAGVCGTMSSTGDSNEAHSHGGGESKVNGAVHNGGLHDVNDADNVANLKHLPHGSGYTHVVCSGKAWAIWQAQLAAARSAGVVHSPSSTQQQQHSRSAAVSLDASAGIDAVDGLGTAQPLVGSSPVPAASAAQEGVAMAASVAAASDSAAVASIEAAIAAALAGSWEDGFAADTAAEVAAMLAVKMKRARAAGVGARG